MYTYLCGIITMLVSDVDVEQSFQTALPKTRPHDWHHITLRRRMLDTSPTRHFAY